MIRIVGTEWFTSLSQDPLLTKIVGTEWFTSLSQDVLLIRIVGTEWFTSLSQDAVKMNQLQNLLHDSLIATDHVHHCAIIRRKDCNVRASSVGFNVSRTQI